MRKILKIVYTYDHFSIEEEVDKDNWSQWEFIDEMKSLKTNQILIEDNKRLINHNLNLYKTTKNINIFSCHSSQKYNKSEFKYHFYLVWNKIKNYYFYLHNGIPTSKIVSHNYSKPLDCVSLLNGLFRYIPSYLDDDKYAKEDPIMIKFFEKYHNKIPKIKNTIGFINKI